MQNIKGKQLENLYKTSAYTIIGCGGSLDEWVNGYNEMLAEQKIGTPEEGYTYTGKDVNAQYGLQGSNRFSDDLVFLSFKLNGLDLGKLAMFRLRMGDKWFDDLIDNSRPQDEDDYEE